MEEDIADQNGNENNSNSNPPLQGRFHHYGRVSGDPRSGSNNFIFSLNILGILIKRGCMQRYWDLIVSEYNVRNEHRISNSSNDVSVQSSNNSNSPESSPAIQPVTGTSPLRDNIIELILHIVNSAEEYTSDTLEQVFLEFKRFKESSRCSDHVRDAMKGFTSNPDQEMTSIKTFLAILALLHSWPANDEYSKKFQIKLATEYMKSGFIVDCNLFCFADHTNQENDDNDVDINDDNAIDDNEADDNENNNDDNEDDNENNNSENMNSNDMMNENNDSQNDSNVNNINEIKNNHDENRIHNDNDNNNAGAETQYTEHSYRAQIRLPTILTFKPFDTTSTFDCDAVWHGAIRDSVCSSAIQHIQTQKRLGDNNRVYDECSVQNKWQWDRKELHFKISALCDETDSFVPFAIAWIEHAELDSSKNPRLQPRRLLKVSPFVLNDGTKLGVTALVCNLSSFVISFPIYLQLVCYI